MAEISNLWLDSIAFLQKVSFILASSLVLWYQKILSKYKLLAHALLHHVKYPSGISFLRCYSSIGRRGSNQSLSLGENCLLDSIIQHELFHALGFFQEQSRLERDFFVTIHWDNIIKGEKRVCSGGGAGSKLAKDVFHKGSNPN